MKKTIDLNKKALGEIKEVIDLLNIEGYGDIPKAIKFSVTYTLAKLKEDLKVIPGLSDDDFKLWLSSIKNLRASEIRLKKIEKLKTEALK